MLPIISKIDVDISFFFAIHSFAARPLLRLISPAPALPSVPTALSFPQIRNLVKANKERYVSCWRSQKVRPSLLIHKEKEKKLSLLHEKSTHPRDIRRFSSEDLFPREIKSLYISEIGKAFKLTRLQAGQAHEG